MILQFPLDITSGVVFDGLRTMALGALALGCLSSFLFVHLLVRWSKLMVRSGWQFVFVSSGGSSPSSRDIFCFLDFELLGFPFLTGLGYFLHCYITPIISGPFPVSATELFPF